MRPLSLLFLLACGKTASDAPSPTPPPCSRSIPKEIPTETG